MAGCTPNIGRNIVFLGENGLRSQSFVDDWTATEYLSLVLQVLMARFEFIKSLKNSLADTFRHRWHGILLVVKCKVIKNLLSLFIHSLKSICNDGGHFVTKRRVVSEQGW